MEKNKYLEKIAGDKSNLLRMSLKYGKGVTGKTTEGFANEFKHGTGTGFGPSVTPRKPGFNDRKSLINGLSLQAGKGKPMNEVLTERYGK